MMRVILTVVGALALLGLLAPSAVAAKPHFVKGPTFTTANGALQATGSIAGLGNEDVTVVLEGTATVQCRNRGGNVPPGQTETVSGSQTITDVKNGRVNFDVTTAQVTDICPGPMTPEATFTSATLTVFQGGEAVLQETFAP